MTMLRVRQQLQRGNFSLPVNLELPLEGITAFMGESGTGKTSLLRAIAGLDRHDNGEVRLGDVSWQDAQTFVPVHQRELGYVFQEDNLLAHLDVRGNLAFAARRSGATQEDVAQFVNRLRLEPLLQRKAHQLSGGERQRVALARAFLADAPILILDEATSSLDSESERLIQQAMERLMAGRTTLVVAHRLSTVRAMDRLLVFDKGRIAETGSHAELLQRDGGLYRRLLELQALDYRASEITDDATPPPAAAGWDAPRNAAMPATG